MRIIAGEKRSRLLIAPDGQETRPTADKVKEALFSILGSRVYDAEVLDLYSGSGALALEALSRGARSAVMVDRDRKAGEAIRKNIRSLAYEEKAVFLPVSDTEAIKRLKNEKRSFDLVFLDPPYRMDTAPVCVLLREAGLLRDDCCIVSEHLKEEKPDPGEGFEITDERHYGITGITLLKKLGDVAEYKEKRKEVDLNG